MVRFLCSTKFKTLRHGLTSKKDNRLR